MAGSGAAVIPGMLTPHCSLLPRLWVQERQHTGPRGHWFHHTAGLGWKNEFVVGIKCIFCMSVTPKLLPLPSDAELRKSQRFQVFVPTLLHCKDWHMLIKVVLLRKTPAKEEAAQNSQGASWAGWGLRKRSRLGRELWTFHHTTQSLALWGGRQSFVPHISELLAVCQRSGGHHFLGEVVLAANTHGSW